ncbi:MAG: TSUP family transporter, partial [Bacteroidota bacterium]
MTESWLIPLIAFAASLLTFFSGFGLGTLLAPAFMLFFPVDLSIALTGIVHFANNLFKLGLVGKQANKDVLLRFGIPAVVAAFAGSWLLLEISDMPVLYRYQLSGRN